MFIRRFCSVLPKYNHLGRRMCQTDVEKKGKAKEMLSDAKELYFAFVPFAMVGTIVGSMFSDTQSTNHEICFLEHFIYSFTSGVFLGGTFPVSFPIIALNVWRKKREQNDKC